MKKQKKQPVERKIEEDQVRSVVNDVLRPDEQPDFQYVLFVPESYGAPDAWRAVRFYDIEDVEDYLVNTAVILNDIKLYEISRIVPLRITGIYDNAPGLYEIDRPEITD